MESRRRQAALLAADQQGVEKLPREGFLFEKEKQRSKHEEKEMGKREKAEWQRPKQQQWPVEEKRKKEEEEKREEEKGEDQGENPWYDKVTGEEGLRELEREREKESTETETERKEMRETEKESMEKQKEKLRVQRRSRTFEACEDGSDSPSATAPVQKPPPGSRLSTVSAHLLSVLLQILLLCWPKQSPEGSLRRTFGHTHTHTHTHTKKKKKKKKKKRSERKRGN